MRYIFLIVVISIAFISCQKDENQVKKGNPDLIGNWINPVYIDTLVTYSKAESLIENQYGIAFSENNKCVERKNNGWCGTPPITTADYEGNWAISNDSIVNITVGYWGGRADYTWKIISLNDQKLIIVNIRENYQQQK